MQKHMICLAMSYVYNSVDTKYINKYVTGPAKIGHICTHNFALFLNFNL